MEINPLIQKGHINVEHGNLRMDVTLKYFYSKLYICQTSL